MGTWIHLDFIRCPLIIQMSIFIIHSVGGGVQLGVPRSSRTRRAVISQKYKTDFTIVGEILLHSSALDGGKDTQDITKGPRVFRSTLTGFSFSLNLSKLHILM